MADYAAPNQQIETRADIGTDPAGVVAFWLQQLKLAEREDRTFVRQGRKIVQRYRAEMPKVATTRPPARFNILWSNVETLKPILYGRTPKPDVERRHKNNDATARLGAEIIERALSYEDDLDEFDDVMQCVVEDRLLPGRGVARVYYEAKYGEPEADLEAEPDEETGEQPTFRPVQSERAPVRYVFWEDYRESPARSGHEVWWKAYRTYLTRDELKERFGNKIGSAITLDYTPRGMGDSGGGDGETGPQADAFKKAQIWEIWDKKKQEVVWIAPSYKERPCDRKSDPYELPGFFPSPDSLRATVTNETRTPVSDYTEYQDQAVELDVLTSRIDRLQRALKVAGVYPSSEKATIQQLVDETSENRLIPVESWAILQDKGGLQNMILWLPIEQIAKVLISLYEARDKVLQTLYQTTGMADILRGETNPNETLGAQQLKSQFATRRISRAQKQVARFARDLMRLRGFIIARHFSPETLSKMTGLPEPLPELPPMPPMMIPAEASQQMPQDTPSPGGQSGNVVPHPAMAGTGSMSELRSSVMASHAINGPIPARPPMQMNPAFLQWEHMKQALDAQMQRRQQQFLKACELISEDAAQSYKIDIEADSTIASDEQEEKTSRIEFLQAITPFLETVLPQMQGNPALAPLGKELVLFAVRGFRVSRQLEDAFETALDQMAQAGPQSPSGAGSKNTKSPMEVQAEAQESAGKLQVQQQQNAVKMQQIAAEQQIEREKLSAQQDKDAAELAMRGREMQGREALENARIQHLQTRDTVGLV